MNALRNYAPVAARVLLGLIFFVFGLNGFLHFLPQPPMQGPSATFIGALIGSGYLFTVLKGAEVLCGLALLTGRLVPLALTVLAPIVLNIALFHAFLAPSGMPMVVFILALEIYLAWAWRASFAGVLDVNARPTAADPVAVSTSAVAVGQS